MDPGAPGPNAGRRRRTRRRTWTQRTTSRLRRRAPAIQGSADRSAGRRQGPGRSAGHECGTPPNVGGTAEGNDLSSRKRRTWSFSDSRAPRASEAPTASEPPTDEGTNRNDRPAQPERSQAPRRQRRHDPPARHADGRPRDPHRRLPAPRRRHHARLPARVRGGRRAAGPLQLPRRRAATTPGGHGRPRPHDHPPGRRRGLCPGPARHRDGHAGPPRGPPRIRPEAQGPADRGDAPLHRRRGRRARLRGHLHVRAVRPAPGSGPGRRAAGRVHRDGPRHRLRPPHPPALGDRLAAHGGTRPRRALPDRGAGDLRGAREDGASVGRRDGRRPSRDRTPAPTDRLSDAGLGQVETSLGRDQYIRAVETAKDAIAAGEAIQVVLARRQSFDLPVLADGTSWTASASIAPCDASTPRRTCSSRGRLHSRSSEPARSSCSRSWATA